MTRDEAAHAYRNSDQFTTDAVEWLAANPPEYLKRAAIYEYARSDAYATVIDDAVQGHGLAWERTS